MPEHSATVTWERRESAFVDNQYSRGHRWLFDGGIEVAASSSPSVIPQRPELAGADPRTPTFTGDMP